MCPYKLFSFPQILIESLKYFPHVTGHPVYIDWHYEADQSTLDPPSPLCSLHRGKRWLRRDLFSSPAPHSTAPSSYPVRGWDTLSPSHALPSIEHSFARREGSASKRVTQGGRTKTDRSLLSSTARERVRQGGRLIVGASGKLFFRAVVVCTYRWIVFGCAR